MYVRVCIHVHMHVYLYACAWCIHLSIWCTYIYIYIWYIIYLYICLILNDDNHHRKLGQKAPAWFRFLFVQRLSHNIYHASLLGMDRISNWPDIRPWCQKGNWISGKSWMLNLMSGRISDIWPNIRPDTNYRTENPAGGLIRNPGRIIRSIPTLWGFCIVVMQNINPATKIFAV